MNLTIAGQFLYWGLILSNTNKIKFKLEKNEVYL
jgi:hypothetical protein